MENATFERYFIVSAKIGLDGRQTMCNSVADDWDHAYGAYTYLSGMMADDNTVMAYLIIMVADDGCRYIEEESDSRSKHLIDMRPLVDWIEQQEGITMLRPKPEAGFIEN